MKPHLRIYRLFTNKVVESGFIRERTTWWKQRHGAVVQGIHLHKFSFTTSFRVHAAIHVAEFDPPAAPWLNGISSYDGWYENGNAHALRPTKTPVTRRYSFDYTEDSESWQHCADELFAFTRDILIPWFAQWKELERLVNDPNSPLTCDQKAFLRRA